MSQMLSTERERDSVNDAVASCENAKYNKIRMRLEGGENVINDYTLLNLSLGMGIEGSW